MRRYIGMRLATLALGLWLSGAQVTTWTDCCCGSFCLHKDACTGCGGEGMPGGQDSASARGRCGSAMGMGPREGCPKDACSHIEPQSDVCSVQADDDFVPVLVLTIEPFTLPAPASGLLVPIQEESRGPPRAEDPPLYLRYEVLLI